MCFARFTPLIARLLSALTAVLASAAELIYENGVANWVGQDINLNEAIPD